VFLYHRLLSCGLRLAATAGTDVFLSFSRLPLASNPPGWGRVYAHLDGAPLSVEAFAAAVRAGRTVVTNGPWLTSDVDGRGPGAVIDAAPGDRLTVSADAIGADRLTIVGPDGVLGSGGRLEYTVDGPTWLAAVARGPATGLAPAGLAHTTPVYVDVDGARVARAGAAEWCLGLVDGLERLLVEHGVPGSALQLEITETQLLGDAPDAHAVLDRLARIGVSWAIDDYGTGYSSLSQLQRLPVDEIKIDRSFVLAMDGDGAGEAIVRSTVDLARALDVRVTAEGVETAAALARVAEIGCDYAQGFYVARPEPGAGRRFAPADVVPFRRIRA
jgi:hypothetical protein